MRNTPMSSATRAAVARELNDSRTTTRPAVHVQRTRKDGSWGVPMEIDRQHTHSGLETDEQVVERMARNNPQHGWRVAQR